MSDHGDARLRYWNTLSRGRAVRGQPCVLARHFLHRRRLSNSFSVQTRGGGVAVVRLVVPAGRYCLHPARRRGRRRRGDRATDAALAPRRAGAGVSGRDVHRRHVRPPVLSALVSRRAAGGLSGAGHRAPVPPRRGPSPKRPVYQPRYVAAPSVAVVGRADRECPATLWNGSQPALPVSRSLSQTDAVRSRGAAANLAGPMAGDRSPSHSFCGGYRLRRSGAPGRSRTTCTGCSRSRPGA